MKISPRELREAQIPSKAFGFNQDVVDALLERAADTIEGLIEENRQLFEALERMRSEGRSEPVNDPFEGVQDVVAPEPEATQAPEPEVEETVAPAASIDENLLLSQMSEKEELINKTLLLAQKTADETLKTAKDQADKLVETAKANADELVASAQTDADELVASATAKAQSVTGTASEQAEKDLAEAQEKAQNMVAAAQGQAEELVASAEEKAESIHSEEREKFESLVAQLTQERAQLLSDIKILQDFDSEHRNKLREVVEKDLEVLVERESIDVGAIPELPTIKIEEKPKATNKKPKENKENEEVVAHSEMPVGSASFDEMLEETPVVEPASADDIDDEVLFSEEIEVEAIETVDSSPTPQKESAYDSGDPFAAFVDSPTVVEPAGEEIDELDAQVVEPAGSQVESSDSSPAFEPGAKGKSKKQDNLDDDDFFASLREAVADDAPLGPSEDDEDKDDDDEHGGKFKGLFKK